MTQLQSTLLWRFIRGGVAAAVASMIPLTITITVNDMGTLKSWLVALGLAGFTGFVSGLLQALDKWSRYQE